MCLKSKYVLLYFLITKIRKLSSNSFTNMEVHTQSLSTPTRQWLPRRPRRYSCYEARSTSVFDFFVVDYLVTSLFLSLFSILTNRNTKQRTPAAVGTAPIDRPESRFGRWRFLEIYEGSVGDRWEDRFPAVDLFSLLMMVMMTMIIIIFNFRVPNLLFEAANAY